MLARTNYDPDRKLYALRHDVRAAPSPTLRISQQVLENYPAFPVLEHLDRLRVAATVRADPRARLVVLQNGPIVILEEIPAE